MMIKYYKDIKCNCCRRTTQNVQTKYKYLKVEKNISFKQITFYSFWRFNDE